LFEIDAVGMLWKGFREFTSRQVETLGMIASGCSATEVAQVLGLAHQTFEQHLKEMRLKLRARNTMHLAAIAFATGLMAAIDIDRRFEQHRLVAKMEAP